MRAILALREEWRLALASGIAFLVGALASEYVVHRADGFTAIWPCNAVTFALLLVNGHSPLRRRAILIGAAIGSLSSSILIGQPWEMCLGFPLANTLEAAIGATVYRARGGEAGAFSRVVDVTALVYACICAPIISATIVAGVLGSGLGMPFVASWLNWYGSAVLGIAIIAPATVVALHWREVVSGGMRPNWLTEAVLVLGLTTAMALFAFYADLVRTPRAPMLFALYPFVTLATFRLRQLGAIAAILIITLIGTQATVSDIGPIARLDVSPAEGLLFLQIFLATTVLTALPVGAALAERDARSEEARLLADQFRAVVENVDKVIFRLDRSARWTYLNPAWEEITGLTVEASLDHDWAERMVTATPGEIESWAQPILTGEVDSSLRLVRFETADNGLRWMELSLQALRDGAGATIGATGTMRDVDDRKRLEDHVMLAKRQAEERAREAALMAATDELTGLANRRAFGRHLERMLDSLSIGEEHLALAVFDADHFKAVNDAYGHAVGDRVLQRVASRALGIVRSGDVVGRIGGEEFGILMPGAAIEAAHAVAERLRQAIQAETLDGEEELPAITISIGIAAARRGQKAEDVSLEADRALYAAKRAGRNCVQIAA
jgi:diguanylate cyclase (GGDEF)-like protein/PAS domain S-box-containing protein